MYLVFRCNASRAPRRVPRTSRILPWWLCRAVGASDGRLFQQRWERQIHVCASRKKEKERLVLYEAVLDDKEHNLRQHFDTELKLDFSKSKKKFYKNEKNNYDGSGTSSQKAQKTPPAYAVLCILYYVCYV